MSTVRLRGGKRRDSPSQLVADRAALERFAGWAAAQQEDRLSLLFTPWGEGLVRSWYRRTLAELSRLPHRDLATRGIRHSVGVVGLPEHLEHARRLRADLPAHVYLWVNAAEGHTYTDAEQWTALDPLFPYSRHPHRSAGLPCRTGESVISVDGEGTVRRCHFVRSELGNVYDGSYRAQLRPRACPLAVCDCHIGYVHLETLPLYDVFAGGVLERIPAGQ